MTVERRVPLISIEEERILFGPFDRHIKRARSAYGLRVNTRDGALRVRGDDASVADFVARVESLLASIRDGCTPPPDEVASYLLAGRESPTPARAEEPSRSPSPLRPTGLVADPFALPEPRTEKQQEYLDAIEQHEVTFAAGPAGTGKTYLAVASAVASLQSGLCRRLVLTRPAVEAGEHLGYLPGDYQEKVHPYLRPLYDALHDLLGPAGARRLRGLGIVEIAPLAFMRGRTLNHSFVILDEAQNATAGQMKMLMTRVGEGTKLVITGDTSQSDLPEGKSGLRDSMIRIQGTPGVAVIRFGRTDVQRSPIVQRILEAYGEDA